MAGSDSPKRMAAQPTFGTLKATSKIRSYSESVASRAESGQVRSVVAALRYEHLDFYDSPNTDRRIGDSTTVRLDRQKNVPAPREAVNLQIQVNEKSGKMRDRGTTIGQVLVPKAVLDAVPAHANDSVKRGLVRTIRDALLRSYESDGDWYYITVS